MYENVNKSHPYIEKELEGSETYDRVILYGKAERSMALERPLVLDQEITTENMHEYDVEEIRPLLFRISRANGSPITKGETSWLVGSKNFPRPNRGLRTSTAVTGLPGRTSKGNPPLWVHSEVENTVVDKDLILTKSSGSRVEARTDNRLVTIQVGYKFSTVLFWEDRHRCGKEEVSDLNAALYMASKFLGKPVYHHLFVVRA